MAPIGGSSALYRTEHVMRMDMVGLMQDLHRQIRDVLIDRNNAKGPGGTIPKGNKGIEVRAQIGQLVDDTFTGKIPGRAGRYAFGEDDVTPLAPYPRLINRWIGDVVSAVVNGHATYLRRVVPEDVQAMLARTSRMSEQDDEWPDFSTRPLVGPSSSSGGVSGVSAARRAFLKKYDGLRIFRPNPLAAYESAHTWVDPNGYRLSDRIWNTSQVVRRQIDQVVARGIEKGTSAVDIATEVEQYLIPSRKGVVTVKPYGKKRQGYMSYDAMRLGRTEISRAHGAVAKAAGILNPYVETMIWALSMSHPKIDICDDLAAGSPYPVESSPVPCADSHPHCLCNVQPGVTKSPARVTAELREALIEAETVFLRPHFTPLQTQAVTAMLLGAAQSSLSSAFGLAA